jgi:hypothetical protein
MTEAQLRKVIREELMKEMGMPPKDEKPSLGFSGKQMAAMAAVGVAGNAAFAQLQNFFQKNPEILKAVKAYLKHEGYMEQ